MIGVNACKEYLKTGEAEEKLLYLYADSGLISYEKARYEKALDRFSALYGERDIRIFSAPGRSEVMGNHTDHQHGEIIAASINLDVIAVVHPTEDAMIRMTSDGYDEIVMDTRDTELRSDGEGGTAAMIRGVVKGFQDRGYRVGGFLAYATSDVLIGGGLSSSAAFETLIGTILSEVYNEGKVSPEEIALIGQFAENVYFGKPCGLMDQMACSVGGLIHVDFGNPEKAQVEKIDFDLGRNGYSLCITDTKSSHDNLTDEYAAIPAEMKMVAGYFGKEYLLGITLEDLLQNAGELRKCFGDRAFLRALHFVKENMRVREGVNALKEKNVDAFLRNVRLSGKSSFETLQNVYVSSDVRHQNVSVALAVSDAVLDSKKSANRVHGGGFAGTIQAFVADADVAVYKKAMDTVFGTDACRVLKIRPVGGVKVLG